MHSWYYNLSVLMSPWGVLCGCTGDSIGVNKDVLGGFLLLQSVFAVAFNYILCIVFGGVDYRIFDAEARCFVEFILVKC